MSQPASLTTEPQTARRMRLLGLLQGLGVRPAIARHAQRWGLRGSVKNIRGGVVIEVEGVASHVQAFSSSLSHCLPPEAVIEDWRQEAVGPVGRDPFRIEHSDEAYEQATRVPLDRAICPVCAAEVYDERNRRLAYAFTSCCQCGPRYSVVERMPFDRAASAMRGFEMCEACWAEYTSWEDRRAHSQLNACSKCGPRLWFAPSRTNFVDQEPVWNSDGQLLKQSQYQGHSALEATAAVVLRGGLVAIKGLGGYQLVCDALNAQAIWRLRKRKQRPAKPLAVMFADDQQLTAWVELSEPETAGLRDASGAIVLLRKRRPWEHQEIAPGLNQIGVLLPTTPLHLLLLRAVGRPLIVTSGNVGSDPIEYIASSAEQRLGTVADAFLHHDRPIVRPIDDGVVNYHGSRRQIIRGGRGLMPMVLAAPVKHHVLAVGGHQKTAIALSNGCEAVLGPHIGDQDSLASRQRFAQMVTEFSELYHCRPELVVHDLHPDYATTTWSERQDGLRLAVQHHHAHAVSAMAEHGWLERQVLAVVFDGSGYGTDGSIWGGEFLLSTLQGFARLAHLRPFALIGGEAAIRNPRGTLSWMLRASGYDVATIQRLLPDYDEQQVRQSLQLAPASIQSSSIGRLFDAVACLILRRHNVTFEGELAMQLEAICDPSERLAYELPLINTTEFAPADNAPGLAPDASLAARSDAPSVGAPRSADRPGSGTLTKQLDWRPLLRSIVRDCDARVSPGRIAMRFHRTLVAGIVQLVASHTNLPIVFSGGVFQNRILLELVSRQLADHPAGIGLPGDIPVNDGGLAAGQLLIGHRWLEDRQACV